MAFLGRTFNLPPCNAERLFPPGVRVQATLQVCAISRTRSPWALASGFLRTGFGHMPPEAPTMYRLGQLREDGIDTTLIVHLTNEFDADYLLGRVFWCGCEYIAFTLFNVFTNTTNTFPHARQMHTLSYAPAPAVAAAAAPAPAAAVEEPEAVVPATAPGTGDE